MSSIGRPGICSNLISGAKYQFSTSSAALKSHYDTLGIHPRSTQNDIKTAYYELTKIYHPDKNKSETAKGKFRDITTAYEVLGNYKSRKMYDRGMRPGERHVDTRDPEEKKKEDAQTRFYRSRMTRSHVVAPDGRTPIYNFDEWTKAHYGELINRKLRTKESLELKQTYQRYNNPGMHDGTAWLPIIMMFAMLTTVMCTSMIDQNQDRDRIVDSKKQANASGNRSDNSKESSSASVE